MKDEDKTNEKLLEQLAALEQRVHELERLEGQCKQQEQALRQQLAQEQAARHQAEQALQAAHKQLADVFEILPGALIGVDTQWRYTFVNSHAEVLLGKSRSELLGRSAWDVFPSLIDTQAYRLCQQAMAHQEPIEYEEFYPEFDKWFSIRLYPSSDGLSTYFRDITEQRRVEATLRQTEERLRIALTSAQMIAWDMNLKTNDVVCAGNATEVWGIHTGTGEEFFAIIHPDDRSNVIQAYERALSGETSYAQEYRIISPDGRMRWIDSQGRVYLDVDGQPERIIGVSVDITQRKQAEEERTRLLEREQAARAIAEAERRRLKDVLTQLPAMFAILTGPNHIFEFANQTFLEISGRTQDIIGKTDREVFPEQEGQLFFDIHDHVYRTGEIVRGEEYLSRWDPKGDGNLVEGFFNLVYLPLKDSQGQVEGILIHGIEVTKQVRARQQVEQLLVTQREAEERLRVAIKNSPLTVFNQDQELRYTWIYNPTFDYTPETVVGKRDEDLVSTEDAAVLTRIKRQVLETGIGQRQEVKLTAQGQDWYYDLTVEPLRDKVGDIIGITCAVVDVSERKQSEAEREQLLASERAALAETEKMQRQLSVIFETSPVGIGLLNHEQRFMAINEALAEINGLSREQHLGHTIPELFDQSDPELVQLFERLYTTGEPFISPQFAVNAPGRDDRRPGYYNVYYLPIANRRAEVEEVLVYVVDVTQRVRLEQAQQYLSKASAVLASSLDYQTTLERVAQLTVPELADWCTVHVVKEDGSIEQLAVAHVDPAKIEWAHQMRDKYPLNPDDSHGVALTLRTGQPDLVTEIPDEMLVQAAHDPEHLEILRQIGFKSFMSVPLRVQQRIMGVISFVAAESGRRYDQTDLRLAQELARRASLAIDNAQLYRVAVAHRAQAEAANRVKDEFLAVLSHELRTPLNPILGWAKLLRDRRLDANKTAFALETIERNAKLQAQLIEDLLDISRILQGKLRLDVSPVDLIATIEAAIETVRLSAEAKSIQLHVYLEPLVGQVLGDGDRLQQVIWNLLSNAIKFTPEGGRVDIRLEPVGTHAQITVSDKGQGINPDFLSHVFDAFRQADSKTTRRFGGLGLGLSIARHLVELHGGTIRADSAGEGQGATFTVQLPLMVADSAAVPERTQTKQLLGLSGIRVLTVDDDLDNLELVSFILEQSGAVVSAVSSANDALEVMAQFKPDILVSDIGMPQMDGYTLIRQVRLRASEAQIPAIALTAYAGELNQQQAIEAGFQMHVAKPVQPEELVKAIANLVS
jgi:PAS domain S-box-containing protein